LSVSGTTSVPLASWIVCAQNEAARGAFELSRPTSALPHWRSASMKLMIAIGVSQMAAATATMSSKGCSRGVSRVRPQHPSPDDAAE
jgi:hypothetical protein